MTQLYELIYISELAEGGALTHVAEILHEARANNAALEVTGVLLFDGSSFIQHFEGERSRVLRLFDRIGADTRHTNVRWLHDATITAREYASFLAGYWYSDVAEGVVTSLSAFQGPALRAQLLTRRNEFDLVR